MNRTAERVLSIIAVIMTAIGTICGFIFMAFYSFLQNDPGFQQEMKMELLADPTYTQADVDAVFVFFDVLGGFLWFLIIAMIISIVLNIIGIVNIWKDKNSKLAGIMFIIAGIFGGIVSLPSILLYIAAILCFTKKPPLQEEPQFVDQPYDSDSMRPL
ncbi:MULTISPECIES: DUF4064 domain-containing protein [Sporosarcina]|uniref:DUF4064 domain-containing protein n=1 Tax=Sporosarcina contaminans TaxID=633403 RepID=A0ABW3TZ54_9BACL